MSRFYCLIFLFALSTGAFAGEYKLLDGTVLAGEPISPNAVGIVIRDADNKMLPRTPWAKFSQETLKEFLKDRKMKTFVEVLVEPDPEPDGVQAPLAVVRPPKPAYKWKEVERLDRYADRPGLIASIFSTSIGWISFLLCYGVNFYAGYEIALFRRRPTKLVLAACIVPVVGQVVFLCLPKVDENKPATAKPAVEAPPPAEAPAKAPAKPGAHGLRPAKAAAHAPVAEPEPVAEAAPEPEAETIVAAPVALPATQYFRRGEVTFNRRFLETKFAPFFKLVPGEKEKDMVLIFITTAGDFLAKRINKVTQTDITIVIQKENAFCDMDLSLNDLREIHIRHKDAEA